ncbi:hypothetical protein ATERTT37_001532 [Aspergillus terreus]
MESLPIPSSPGDFFRQSAFGPQRQVPFETVHHAFIHHATRAPDETALLDLSRDVVREVSYGRLLQYAQFTALRLQQNGVLPGSRIAVVTKRSVEMVAGILGILMSGAQYIPLDGAVVADQTLEHAVTESKSSVALCGDAFRSRLQSFDSIKPLVLEELITEAERVGFVPGLDRLVCEGDDEWVANGATFYNCCGPTETTIINTMHKHELGRPLTIGRPLPNNNVYILDENARPVEFGSIGTMWAGGAGVTRGYLGLPDRTAERYRPDPFVNDAAVAMMVEGQLIGFVSPVSCDLQALRAHLEAKLPYYAIPCEWFPMDTFPLTTNGKLDKRAMVEQFRHQKEAPFLPSDLVNEKGYIIHQSSRTLSAESDPSEAPRKPLPLAEKKDPKPIRGLRYRIFIVYRRLFSLVWLANLAALLCLIFIPTAGSEWIDIIAFINLTIAVLIRQDAVINVLYTVCCSVPKSWPLAIRRRCAKIYHLGGAHSGAATAATAWYIGSIGHSIYAMVKKPTPSKVAEAALALSLIVMLLLLSMIGLAYPTFRKKRHNTFERTHRFLGWTVLVIIWVQTMLSIRAQRAPGTSMGRAVLVSPNFWMLIVITASIASSWCFLRKVPVDAEVLSNHAVRLHFDYTMPVNGTFTRLSERPLLEWHSFATVPAPTAHNGRPRGYSLVVSRAGDWTGRQISNPPSHLWTRGIPTCGVMRIATLFNRVVLVGTGSGIGPLLGHIQVPTCPFRLVWSTPNPLATFGKDVVDAVYDADPGAVVHDTKTQGRPNLVQLTWEAVQEFEAEAVVVISNEKLTKKVVYGMETRGVAAYGAIWDS